MHPDRPDVDLRKVEKIDLEEESGWTPYCVLLWPARSTASTLNLFIDAELKPLWQIDLDEIDTRFVACYEARYVEHFVDASFERFVDHIAMNLFGEVIFKNRCIPTTVVKEQKGREPNGRRQLKAEYIECFECNSLRLLQWHVHRQLSERPSPLAPGPPQHLQRMRDHPSPGRYRLRTSDTHLLGRRNLRVSSPPQWGVISRFRGHFCQHSSGMLAVGAAKLHQIRCEHMVMEAVFIGIEF
uniref:CACTA en-spm transposon protein n=1 Tax=Panagrellus redivivus TaxID=6233 RepID=A0A7E4W4B1_PANRE